ncbi:MAG TPA: VanZ family protein [Ignavibacteriaceae bacterium]
MYSFLQKYRFYIVNVPLVIYWIILLILTSLPSSMAINMDVSDKIEHFGAYGLLGVFLYLNLFLQEKFALLKKYPATFTVIIASIYGLLDELHQLFVPGRSAELLDWLADFLGSLTAVLITRYLVKKIKQNEIEKSKLKAGTF